MTSNHLALPSSPDVRSSTRDEIDQLALRAVAMSRWANRKKKKPAGWDYIEPTLSRLESELRDGECLACHLMWALLAIALVSRCVHVASNQRAA